MGISSLAFKIDKNVSYIKDLKNGYYLIKASDKLSKEGRKNKKKILFIRKLQNCLFILMEKAS